MALHTKTDIIMKTYNKLYKKVYSYKNLYEAYREARRGKTKKGDVKEFEKDLRDNLMALHRELKEQSYKPRQLIIFILRDPKTRRISKSDFRDRVVHHALVQVIEEIFQKIFIHDSCANQRSKGNLLGIKRLHRFMNKISKNGKINGWFNNNQVRGYYLKADIKHYFQEVDHEILINIIKRKITDEKVIWLVGQILSNNPFGWGGERRSECRKGMPLGNLTSQFFANIYLNELDYFVKHRLKAKYYIRYVDDFIILHKSREQLIKWKQEINKFLNDKLRLTLHPDKSFIKSVSAGIGFVGFRNFYHYRLLRKRNIRKMHVKVRKYKEDEISYDKIMESFQGWNAYAKWADSFGVRREILKKIYQSN